MGNLIQRFSAGAKTGLGTFLTLAALGGIGVWGAANDWQIGGASGPKDKDEDKETAGASALVVAGKPGSKQPTRLEFPSAAVVEKAGIQTEPVELRDMAYQVTANGMLDYVPRRYAKLGSPTAGRIWRVEKEYGAKVQKGDTLLIIDAAEVGKAKADLVQSLAMVDFRHQELKALKAAAASVPEAILRQAESALRQARLRVYNDQQRLLNLGLPVRLEELEGLSDRERVAYLRLFGLDEETRKQIDRDTVTANLLPLKAPFDGEVVQHPRAAAGEVVGARDSRPLFVVADVTHLHIKLEVSPEDVGQVRLGQDVEFEPENRSGEKATGQVAHISPEVNEKTRRVLVHAEVSNRDLRFRPNTFGTGRIRVRKLRALAVPDAAIQQDSRLEKRIGGSSVVFVRRAPTIFEVRPVRVGIRADGFTEVAGVGRGEEVVTVGSHALRAELLRDLIAGEE